MDPPLQVLPSARYSSYTPGPGQHEAEVYRMENVTYADLDPKAFMRPENRVLPSSGLVNNQKPAYATISVSKSHLV